MDARLQAFRNLLPFEGYPVRDVAFSPKADMVLVCTGSSSVKVGWGLAWFLPNFCH